MQLACVITVYLYRNLNTKHLSAEDLFADLWKLDKYFDQWFGEAYDEYYDRMNSYGGHY